MVLAHKSAWLPFTNQQQLNASRNQEGGGRLVPWLLERLRHCREVNLDAVMRQCPLAHEAMQQSPSMLSVVLGMINELGLALQM